MKNIRMAISKLNAKKVPALSLVLVAIVGAVAGVIAGSITVTQLSYTGEQGTYHNNTGAFTVIDNGLQVAANDATANYSNDTQIGPSGTQSFNGNAITGGHWVDSFSFSTTLTGASDHKITITLRDGSGTFGTALTGFPYVTFIKAPTSSSSATITLYLDLGASPLTTPITAYITVS